jgi:hypothetical protein
VFVPPDSQYSSLTKTSSVGSGDSQQQQQQQPPARDLSWQQHQQQIWAGAGPAGLRDNGQAVVLHEGEGWVGWLYQGAWHSGACAAQEHMVCMVMQRVLRLEHTMPYADSACCISQAI